MKTYREINVEWIALRVGSKVESLSSFVPVLCYALDYCILRDLENIGFIVHFILEAQIFIMNLID